MKVILITQPIVVIVAVALLIPCYGYIFTQRKPSRLSMSGIFDNSELTLKSPCKINLFLRILSRRPSGYHDLSSLFQAISLYDTLHFQPLPAGAQVDVMT
eukprot:gene43041-52600_t